MPERQTHYVYAKFSAFNVEKGHMVFSQTIIWMQFKREQKRFSKNDSIALLPRHLPKASLLYAEGIDLGCCALCAN